MFPSAQWTGKKIQQGLDAREQHGPAPTLLERGLKLHQESPESFPRDILMAHMVSSVSLNTTHLFFALVLVGFTHYDLG